MTARKKFHNAITASAECKLLVNYIGQRVLDLHGAGLGDVRGDFSIRMNAKKSNGLCCAMLLGHGLRNSGDDNLSQSKLKANCQPILL